MCVAAPGRVTDIVNNTCTVDYDGNKISADKGIVDVKIGDYVLVHAGLIIQVLPEDEARYMNELFKELGELE